MVSYEGNVLGLLVRPLPAHRGPRLVPTGRQSYATLPCRGSLTLHAHSPQSLRPPHPGEPSASVPRLAPLPTHSRFAPAPAFPSRHVSAAPVSAPRASPRCRLPARCPGAAAPSSQLAAAQQSAEQHGCWATGEQTPFCWAACSGNRARTECDSVRCCRSPLSSENHACARS